MWLEILWLAAAFGAAVAALVVSLRIAWSGDRHPALRVAAGLTAGLLGLGVTGVVVASGAAAILVLLGPTSEETEDGPFPLGREHLIGQSSFDDVTRCPLEFPQLRKVERCMGEDRSFQEKSWWVAASGPSREAGAPGDAQTCRRFGVDGYDRCSFLEISNEPERTRSRLVVGRARPRDRSDLLVIEIAGVAPRDAVRGALRRLAGSPEP